MYELELYRVVSEIKDKKASNVLLQLPDGMRPFALKLVEAIEKSTGTNVFLSGDSCYGACDVAITQAEQLGVDLIVHYGHISMIKDSKIPVIYVHARIDINVDQLVKTILPRLRKYESIGLATTAQHIHQVEEIREKLEGKGIKVFVGKGVGKTPYDAQILGCSYRTVIEISKNVDIFLYIGGGRFHPIGIVLSTGKPVIVTNPYNGEVSNISEEDLMGLAKRRMAAITIAKDSKRFGVLVSSKPGQSKLSKAVEIQRQLKKNGKKVVLIYMDEIRAEHVNNYSELEVFVNTACPRIAIDGVSDIDRPMLTINEAEIVLGLREWEDLWGRSYME